MATSYRTKSETELVWDAGVRRTDTEIRIMAARVRNIALTRQSAGFKDGLDGGMLLNLAATRSEVEADAAQAVADLQPPVARVARGKQRR